MNREKTMNGTPMRGLLCIIGLMLFACIQPLQPGCRSRGSKDRKTDHSPSKGRAVGAGEKAAGSAGIADAAGAPGRPITLDDLFGKKVPEGRPPMQLEWSHDGRTLFFLKPSAEDASVLDLHGFDASTRKATLLMAASALPSGPKVELTEEQAQMEERRRVRHLGITRYVTCKNPSKMLLLSGAKIFHFDLESKKTRLLFARPAGELDPKLSPDGSMVSFVRGGDLHVLDSATLRTTRLTRTGSKTMTNGLAEFIASEELDRYSGHWWSPDGKKIAFVEVDESKVKVVLRPQYSAAKVTVVKQRYPEAGTTNAGVRLGVIDLADGKRVVWAELGDQKDLYLARVDWLGKRLLVQTLSRDQKTLVLRQVDPILGKSIVLITEQDRHYVNLHKDLKEVKGADKGRSGAEKNEGKGGEKGFIWSSEESGARRLYMHDWSGKRLRAITLPDMIVHSLAGLDERGGRVYARICTDRGRQLHLYGFPLDGKDKSGRPERITSDPGWHEVEMDPKASYFADRYSDLGQPPILRIHQASGRMIDEIYRPPPQLLSSLRLARRSLVDLPLADGTVLNGVVFRPEHSMQLMKKLPLLMYVYGGPHGQVAARRWHRTELWHHYLAQHGFVVMLLDGRGTASRGKRFETELYKKLGVVDVADIKAGALFARNLPYVDGSRLGLWGWSYGGYLAVMTALSTGRLFRSVAAVALLADWRFYDTAYTERYLGHPKSSPEAYKQADALRLASRLDTQLLLIHGMADDNVLLKHTLLLAEAFQKAGVMFRMMLYPGAKHSIKKDKSSRHLMRTLTLHFEKTLKH